MARRNLDDDVVEIDDGKTVSPMNLEGMPWYRPDRPKSNDSTRSETPFQSAEKLTFAEKLAFFWGSLKAALLVTAAFFGTFLIVILIVLWVGSR